MNMHIYIYTPTLVGEFECSQHFNNFLKENSMGKFLRNQKVQINFPRKWTKLL